jgi:hypothetical protein
MKTDATIYMAPTPGAHKPEHQDAIYVRRPALYSKDRGDAQALRVEAYAHGGPRQGYWEEGTFYPEGSSLSEPLFMTLVWCSRDHREKWDGMTEHKAGNTCLIQDVDQYVGTQDGIKLQAALQKAQAAIRDWHGQNPTK